MQIPVISCNNLELGIAYLFGCHDRLGLGPKPKYYSPTIKYTE